MFKKLTPWIVSIIAVIVVSSWSAFPLNEKISLGLDLQGGMYLIMKVDVDKIPEESRKDAPQRALEVIRNRIDEFGVKEPQINLQGQDQIVIKLPGVTDRDRALSIIGETALLEFKIVTDDPTLLKQAIEGNVPAGYQLKIVEDDGERILIKSKSEMTGEALSDARVEFDQSRFNMPLVGLTFNPEGAKQFAQVTKENVGKRMAIVLDDTVKSAPRIQEAISGGEAVITGRFTPQEANDLALILRVGALPAPVYIEEERTVGPLLGQDSINAGVKATAMGLGMVFVFMLLYYMVPGVIASIALSLNFLIILGGLGLLGATLTLPGIAGLLLTLGMAVDANVLIYERLREELKLGRSVRQALENGYGKAFTAIIDANITTLLAAFLLFQFGTGPIRGFAATTSIGLIASLFTSIIVTRVIFETLRQKGWLDKIRMLQLIGETKIKFTKWRQVCLIGSLILIAFGLFKFQGAGTEAYGIDFTGGQVQQYRFEQTADIERVRGILNDTGIEDVSIQKFGTENELLIQTGEDTVEQVQAQLSKEYSDNPAQLMRTEQVGPSVGQDLRKRARLAVLWAIIGISAYVAFRFRSWGFGLAAIMALFHDVLITIGALALTGRPLSLTLVAALLAIAGYSINDTIVIFDRIRELKKTARKMSMTDLINQAINSTLSRTILTTVTTLFAVLSLFFFGGEVLNDFAFALLVGLISGIYSTIYIATPLLLFWKK